MKKKSRLLIILMLAASAGKAQLYNAGGTIAIQNNASLFVQGDLKNVSGTVTNDGKIEVQGNFINSGTYNSSANDDSLLMSGTGTDTLNAGTSVLNYLTINKTSSTDIIKLGGPLTINTRLDYLSGIFTTDPVAHPTYVISSPVAAVYNIASGKEIIGVVQRTGWTNGTARIFNQANMLVTTNGGTAPTSFTVTMIPQSGGGDPSQSEREVKRKFLFSQAGGISFTADIRYPYTTSELNNNTEANLTPWELISSEWDARLTPVTHDLTNHFVSTTGIPAADLANEWKLADPKYTFNVTAYIKGAWNNLTGLMRTTLNSGGVLPLTQPFSGAPYNYAGTESVGSIPNANIVDWVLIEHRKPSTGLPGDATASTITGRSAALLLDNGTVVGLDGVTPVTVTIGKQGAAFVVVRHRNHLAIMSNSLPSNATGTFANNYAVLGNSYKKSGATSNPTVLMATTGTGSTLYGMWPGDVNSNGSVTSSDITPVNIAIAGPSTGNTNVYNVRDTNLDKNVTSADASITNASIAAFAASSSSFVDGTGGDTLKSQVPGESK